MTTNLVLFLLLPCLLEPQLYPWLSRASHTAQLRPFPTGERLLPLQSPTLLHNESPCALHITNRIRGLETHPTISVLRSANV